MDVNLHVYLSELSFYVCGNVLKTKTLSANLNLLGLRSSSLATSSMRISLVSTVNFSVSFNECAEKNLKF